MVRCPDGDFSIDMLTAWRKIGMNAPGGRWITSRRALIYVYLVGAAVIAILMVGQGINNGGLERHHDLRDWVLLTAIYGATIVLWPLVGLIVILQLTGILPMPITF